MAPVSERDEMTLHVLALLDGTTVAEQRRQAVHAYATLARQDKDVAEIVRLILASRQAREQHGNVTYIGPRHA